MKTKTIFWEAVLGNLTSNLGSSIVTGHIKGRLFNQSSWQLWQLRKTIDEKGVKFWSIDAPCNLVWTVGQKLDGRYRCEIQEPFFILHRVMLWNFSKKYKHPFDSNHLWTWWCCPSKYPVPVDKPARLRFNWTKITTNTKTAMLSRFHASKNQVFQQMINTPPKMLDLKQH